MAGEFDPIGGDLYGIMGGYPGGGMVGAGQAAQMQQANLLRQQQEAELARQQAGFQQAQAARTSALINPEVQQMQALAQMYQATAGKTGAETTGLQYGNIARGANLPQEITTTGAKLGAEQSEAQRTKMMAQLVPALAMAPQTFNNAPNPDLALDTWGAQAGISKEPWFNSVKQQLRSGATAPQLLTTLLSANPEQIKTETQVAGELGTENIRAQAQRYVADARAESAMRVAQSNKEAKILTSGSNNPEGAVRSLENQIMMERAKPGGGDPLVIQNLETHRDYAQQRVNVQNDIRKIGEANHWSEAQIQQMIAISLGGGQMGAPGNPLQPGAPPTMTPNPTGPVNQPNPANPQSNQQLQTENLPTATNKATGQTIVLRNGQWVPQ